MKIKIIFDYRNLKTPCVCTGKLKVYKRKQMENSYNEYSTRNASMYLTLGRYDSLFCIVCSYSEIQLWHHDFMMLESKIDL